MSDLTYVHDQDTNRSEGLAEDLTSAFVDILTSISEPSRPVDLKEVVETRAKWAIREAMHRNPFRPDTDIHERAVEVLVPLLLAWAAPYVGNLPRDTYRDLGVGMAASGVQALTDAGLVLPDGRIEHEKRQELLRLLSHARSKTEARNGVMGGGYYSAHVDNAEIADIIIASGLLDPKDQS